MAGAAGEGGRGAEATLWGLPGAPSSGTRLTGGPSSQLVLLLLLILILVVGLQVLLGRSVLLVVLLVVVVLIVVVVVLLVAVLLALLRRLLVCLGLGLVSLLWHRVKGGRGEEGAHAGGHGLQV